MHKAIPILLLFPFVAGCLGTEGGNPETSPVCDSFMFGLIEGNFVIPENAGGIPLQITESLTTGGHSTAELIVTRDGVEETGFAVVDSMGRALDPSGSLDGPIAIVLTDDFVEGERITITRRVTCEGLTGEPIDYPEQIVVVTIGPSIPLPTTAGELRVTQGTDSTSVVLTLSADLEPWMHMITGSLLTVGATPLRDGIFLSGGDRDLDWTLTGIDCRPCPTDGGDGPPLVCYPQIWSPGQYDLVVRVGLFGQPAIVESETVTATFDETRCGG